MLNISAFMQTSVKSLAKVHHRLLIAKFQLHLIALWGGLCSSNRCIPNILRYLDVLQSILGF